MLNLSFLARVLVLSASLGCCFPAKSQQAESSSPNSPTTKIFLTTATYGVMAGALVGVASMAFYSNPGAKVRNVAIGASLGLYTGILLGAYVRYVVPDRRGGSRGRASPGAPGLPQSPNAPAASPEDGGAPLLDPDDPLGIGRGSYFWEAPTAIESSIALYPVYFPEQSATGLGVDYQF